MEKAKFEKLKQLFDKEKNVRVAYLFGSAAAGKETKLSDVDIGILFKKILNKKEKLILELKLLDKIANILKEDRIDLVDLDNTSILMKYNIIKERKILKNGRERIKMEKNILSEYLDRKYYSDRHAKFAIERIAEKGLL